MNLLRDNGVDRETRRHLARMNTSPWYAIALKIPDSKYRAKVEHDLTAMLGSDATTGIEGNIVYAVKQLSDKELRKVKTYLESQRKLIDTSKVLRSREYGTFVGNPKYWLRDYAGFS